MRSKIVGVLLAAALFLGACAQGPDPAAFAKEVFATFQHKNREAIVTFLPAEDEFAAEQVKIAREIPVIFKSRLLKHFGSAEKYREYVAGLNDAINNLRREDFNRIRAHLAEALVKDWGYIFSEGRDQFQIDWKEGTFVKFDYVIIKLDLDKDFHPVTMLFMSNIMARVVVAGQITFRANERNFVLEIKGYRFSGSWYLAPGMFIEQKETDNGKKKP